MLVDPSTKNNIEFSPNVDNTIHDSQKIKSQTTLWWVIFILAWFTIIGGIVVTVFWFKWQNQLNELQFEINNASSAIDINLVKRKDILTKLLDATKNYIQYEKSTLEEITKLRSMKLDHNDINKSNEYQNMIENVSRSINVNVENYPNLKANNNVMELMSSSQYLESEIAASRRLYNMYVMNFNKLLYTFPICVKAAKMGLHTLPIFVASEEQKADVNLSF